MGQGHYVALVYGTIPNSKQRKALFDEDGDLKGWTKGYDAEPSRAYESKEEWFGFPITDGMGKWDGKRVKVLSYTAMRIEDVHERFKAPIAAAKKRWDDFATWAKDTHSVALDGGVLLVADYD